MRKGGLHADKCQNDLSDSHDERYFYYSILNFVLEWHKLHCEKPDQATNRNPLTSHTTLNTNMGDFPLHMEVKDMSVGCAAGLHGFSLEV